MSLYFITGSVDKFAEARAILGNVEQLDLDLPEIQEIDPKAIVRAKLLEAKKHREGRFIIEDTSLSFEALNGLPGPLIKWFLKAIGDVALAGLLDGKSNRASARTMVGLADGGEMHFFEGYTSGYIVSPRGGDGFGWDRIFVPDGHDRTFAEMSAVEKNRVSMRRIALEKLKDHLG